MAEAQSDDDNLFDPIMECVKYLSSQKEYLTNPEAKTSSGHNKAAMEFHQFLQDYMSKPSHPETQFFIRKLRLHYKRRLAAQKNVSSKAKRDYYFVTICPPEHITLKQVRKTLVSIQKWTCWSHFIGVLEQRSVKKDDIYGMHIHFLALKTNDYAHSNVKQRLSYYKKKWNTDIQRIDGTFATDKQSYFFSKFGKNKKGIAKSKIMEIDEYFRKKNNIPRFFGEKIIFT